MIWIKVILLKNDKKRYDYLIVGAGIIGMTVAYELKKRDLSISIAIIDKEDNVGKHASGRNSGVLHAGFYYSADSMKAKFTVNGNKKMKAFCKDHNIFVKESKKVVVANNKEELEGLYALHERAKVNGVNTYIIDEKELYDIDQNIKTYKKALYSPTTASVDPKEVCFKLRNNLELLGVGFFFNLSFDKCDLEYDYLINSAGAYADKIAKIHGLAKNFTMLPFKGIYLKYNGPKDDVKINIYPVPNLNNPFLGVHYTVTVDGSIKIGPTAIPAFWRENYKKFDNFKITEFLEIMYYETKLFLKNSFNFRSLAINEMKNYSKESFISKAQKMLKHIDNNFSPIPAGIRAQLLNTDTNELVQDFMVEHTDKSTHILNSVSPAFTCSFAFSEYIVDEVLVNKLRRN